MYDLDPCKRSVHCGGAATIRVHPAHRRVLTRLRLTFSARFRFGLQLRVVLRSRVGVTEMLCGLLHQ